VPQVVFEVLSPGNTATEMNRKSRQYADYGVQEYYEYDPDRNRLRGWVRQEGEIVEIVPNRWVSPLLGIRFEPGEPELVIRHANGEVFATWAQHAAQVQVERLRSLQAETERDQAEMERDQAEMERNQAEMERDQAEMERDQALKQAEALRARLKALGIEP
jgi:hypothetical protein